MKLKLSKAIAVAVCMLSWLTGVTQTPGKDYPVIGGTMPEFSLNNVKYYAKKTISTADVKGKWLVLDFWHQYCTGCIKAFPKVNKLQAEFKDQFQFLLVGKNDKLWGSQVEQVYERYRKVMGLNLAVAYDTTLIDRFGINTYSFVIVVDPAGKVYATTGSEFLTSENLKGLIEGKAPAFLKAYSAFDQYPRYDSTRWRYDKNEFKRRERDVLYQSVLSINKGEFMPWFDESDDQALTEFNQSIGLNIAQLYTLAYLGYRDLTSAQSSDPLRKEFHLYPAVEVKDLSPFNWNWVSREGLYNYSITVPKEKNNKQFLMQQMQRDLKNYFGYEVAIETRMVPCWKLTATAEAADKLKTKGGTAEYNYGVDGMKGRNVNMSYLMAILDNIHMDKHIPFIDETNIKGKVDLVFDAAMMDMDDVVKALQKLGLILQKSEVQRKVFVIKDPVPGKNLTTMTQTRVY